MSKLFQLTTLYYNSVRNVCLSMQQKLPQYPQYHNVVHKASRVVGQDDCTRRES